MAEKTIFLHIGAMKTGTSAIQNVLYQKTGKLSRSGVLVPALSKRARNYLGFSLLNPVPDFIHSRLPLPSAELYRQLSEEIDQSPLQKVVISTESWYQITTDHLLGSEAPRLVHELLGGNRKDRRYRILFYIRRQDRLMESIYNQHIKNNHLYSLLRSPFGEFLDGNSGYGDLLGIVRAWEAVFGRDAIRILPYIERKTNSVQSFFHEIGVDIPDGVTTDSVNESLTNRESELMRLLNGASVNKSTWQRNQALVQMITQWSGETQRGFSYFSESERTRFLDRFNEDNLTLSDLYLKGDTSWFTDRGTWPSPPQAEDISTDDMARFFSVLWSQISQEEIDRFIQRTPVLKKPMK